MILATAAKPGMPLVIKIVIVLIAIFIVGIALYIKKRNDIKMQENIFCNQCGASVSVTASFCNKCGNTLRKSTGAVQPQARIIHNAGMSSKKHSLVSGEKNKGLFKILAGIVLFMVLIIIAMAVISGIKKRTSIYGTWTDANQTVSFTFNEDGNLRISGANNILGADAFQFTEEDGVLHLQAQGLLGVGFDLGYEIEDDMLSISILGQNITLYRVEDSEVIDVVEAENAGDAASIEQAVGNFVEEALDTVQIYSLYGTWTDSYGAISFTFSEDGKLRVSGMSDILSVDAFTFTEVDDDTLQLKADTDNPIAGMVGLNMDYEIEGDSMTVSIAGKQINLVKKE